VIAGMVSGCASIISPSEQQLQFTSEPSQADAYINGNKVGTTPFSVEVPRRKGGLVVTLRKDGYEDVVLSTTTKLNPYVWGNFLWGYGSLTAFLIDYSSDRSVEYYPDSFLVTLPPKVGAAPEQVKEEPAPKQQRSRIVRFVATNYDDLVLQLSKGSGDHLNALFDLLEVPEADRPSAVAKIKPLYIKYDDPVELGRAIEMEFAK